MKHAIPSIGVLLVVLAASLAYAQTGQICLFSDPQGLDCSISDTQPGLLMIYVVHTQTPGATGVQFSAPKPPCFTATWLADTYPFGTAIGNTQTGLTVGYGACLTSPIHVATINYFAVGTTPANCGYSVLPHPMVGRIVEVDCGFQELEARGSVTYINSDFPCTCIVGSEPRLFVDPLHLEFGLNVATRSFQIGNVGGGTLIWSILETVPWLDVSATFGLESAIIDVTVDRSALPTGTYTGEIRISSNGGDATISVSMAVMTETVLAVSPAYFYFAATASHGVLAVSNEGGGTLHWNVTSDQPWMSVDPASGTGDAQIDVHIDRQGLSPGTYYGNLFVTSNGGDATIPVEMIVTDAILVVNPKLLVFSPSAPSNTFSISNAGTGTLSWSLELFDPWVEAAPMSGTGDAVVTVQVDIGSLPCCNMLLGHIRVNSNGGSEVIELKAYPTGPSTGGSIGIYADETGTECNLSDATTGLKAYHVVHLTNFGVTACAYWAPKPSCFTATYLADTNPFPVTIGNSQDGVSIGYGSCRPGPVRVQSITFLTNGNTPECCLYPILGIPTSGNVEVVDCSNNLITAYGVTSVINPSGTCNCGSVKVEESTWGRVKSLYAE